MADNLIVPDGYTIKCNEQQKMTDNVENLVLEHLRHIREKVDRIADDVADLKTHAGSLEEHVSLNI